MTDVDCRSGNIRCRMGHMGGYTHQISGNSAENIKRCQQAARNDCLPIAPLAPGQYDLLIIGDTIYTTDDARGVPFQDNSSELIIDYLNKANIDLSRTYMTKIVKCGAKKRKATVPELNTCRDEYLRKEIELIQPKVVLLVGAASLKAFNLTGRGSLNAIRGKVFEEKFAKWENGPTFKIIPTLNPAQFMYKPNPKLRNRVQHDYVVAKDLLDGRPPSDHYTTDWTLIDTPEKLEWLESRLTNSTLFSFDTECAHLGFMDNPNLCFSFAWGWDECAVLPVLQHDPDAPPEQTYHTLPGFGALNEGLVKGFMERVFNTPHITKAAHNFKFDYNILRWNYGVQCQGFLFDTMVAKHLMDENPPSDLEFLLDLEFAWGDYSAERRKITGQGKELRQTFDKVPDALLWPYAGLDALGTYRLALTYAQRLKARPNLWKFFREESEPLIRPLAKAEWKGADLDTSAVRRLHDEYEQEQVKLLQDMRAKLWPEFNPSSNPQVLRAFGNLGLPDVELEAEESASGYSANKKKLTELIEKGQEPAATFSKQLLTYRNRSKLIGTYLVNAEQDRNADGRLRYTWFQAGPVTGRLSCRFFHQIPKLDEDRVNQGKLVMRDILKVPQGYKYIYGDFKQIELFIMAILSQDQELIKILYGGGDLHTITAFEFLSVVWPGLTEADISKFNRVEVGKKINFGLSYGSEGYSLIKQGKWRDKHGVDHNFTWEMLNQGMLNWRARFHGVGKFTETVPDIVRAQGGTATNAFGRERHFGPLLNQPNVAARSRCEREAINFFIQSLATAITNRTIIEVDRMLERFNVPEDVVCLINTVHDSVAYEVRDDYVEWFSDALHTIATRPIPEMGNAIFNMDIGVGDNWASAEMAA